MGLSATRVGDPMRRDRLLLVSAFAMALPTQLGEVGGDAGNGQASEVEYE